MSEACSNPGCSDSPVVQGRCRACYTYWRRLGRDRPAELIVARGRRHFERRLLTTNHMSVISTHSGGSLTSRRCPICSTVLSAYNPGPRCYSHS